jgi:hypothetical protein
MLLRKYTRQVAFLYEIVQKQKTDTVLAVSVLYKLYLTLYFRGKQPHCIL